MPSLKAKTPACITTIRPSATKLIVWDDSITKNIITLYSLPKRVKIKHYYKMMLLK